MMIDLLEDFSAGNNSVACQKGNKRLLCAIPIKILPNQAQINTGNIFFAQVSCIKVFILVLKI